MLVRGSLFNYRPINLFEADLVIITIAYLLTFYGDIGAGLFACGMGILTDVFSAGPMGLFTLLYLIVFMGIQFGSLLFDLLSITGQMILITLAALLKVILFITLLYFFSIEMTVSSADMFAFASKSLCSGLITPVIFYFFDRLTQVLIEGRWGVSKEEE